jgi:hypothetical protein
MAYLARLSSLSLLVGALGLVGLAGLGGCGEDFNDRVSCTTANDCGLPTDMTERECCGGFCMSVAPGCDSGYRYITSEPGFGDCVVAPMCAVKPDMSIPIDMSKVD